MKKIIWMPSYPKSGNTYVRCFLSHYLFNSSSDFTFESLDKIPKFESKIIFNKIIVWIKHVNVKKFCIMITMFF